MHRTSGLISQEVLIEKASRQVFFKISEPFDEYPIMTTPLATPLLCCSLDELACETSQSLTLEQQQFVRWYDHVVCGHMPETTSTNAGRPVGLHYTMDEIPHPASAGAGPSVASSSRREYYVPTGGLGQWGFQAIHDKRIEITCTFTDNPQPSSVTHQVHDLDTLLEQKLYIDLVCPRHPKKFRLSEHQLRAPESQAYIAGLDKSYHPILVKGSRLAAKPCYVTMRVAFEASDDEKMKAPFPGCWGVGTWICGG
ncbi:hypothetical protein MMC13_000979 [Lambiella insularis]|nr:hypothetical protein [Lambiella insularis]